jgi:glycosyltransferase involved in cell wall biosynthesis
MARFSIILPVRNGGEYVKECINSILHQTIDNFNIIVLDNCSNDGTLEWIGSLQSEKIIIYPSNQSLYIQQNWARIKDVPKNEFMTMIGHDDLLHPHYLEEMEALIQEYPNASLYQTHFDYIDENGKFVRDCIPMTAVQHAHEFLACQMQRKIDSTGTGYMMRSKDFDALGGMPAQYPNLIYSDYELWIKLMLLGYKATSPKKCFSYRLHLSVSKQTNGMLYQDAFSIYVSFIKSLIEKYPEINRVVQQHGKDFLLYFCQSLSHRLLKTPVEERTITVADFIEKCEGFAADLIPGQDFKPMKQWKIKIAEILDRSSFNRLLFKMYKRLSALFSVF